MAFFVNGWIEQLESQDKTDDDTRHVAELAERLFLALHDREEPKAVRQSVLITWLVLARRLRRGRDRATLPDALKFFVKHVGLLDPGALDNVDEAVLVAAIESKPKALASTQALLAAAGVPASQHMIDKYSRGIPVDDDE